MTSKLSLQLYSYDERWRQEFEQARSMLLFAAEGRISAVEHVGATAIPRMSSLPCVDLVAAVDDAASLEATSPYLAGLNYRRAEPPFETTDETIFFVKPKTLLAAFSVHLVVLGSDSWLRHLMIRDWLRAHPDEAASYLRLRRRCIAQAPCDRDAYERYKAAFLEHVAEQAHAHLRDSR